MSPHAASLFDVVPRQQFPVHVRSFDQLTANEHALLAASGLRDYAPIEAWTAEGSNRDLSYSTHSIFRFFGKFPPPIATHLILQHTPEGGLVADPMCGSGTTGVECVLHSRRSVLFDVNPLSLLLSRVKTHFISLALLEAAVRRVQSSYKSPLKSYYNRFPAGLRNAEHWFLPETTESLRRLRSAIDTETEPDIRDFLLVVFASTVRRVSRATTQQGRIFLDANTAEPDALPTFLKRAKSAIEAVSQLPRTKPAQIRVMAHDLRKLPLSEFRNIADLVILHPPYFNGYRYSTINALEMAWLGESLKEVRNSEVHEFFKVGKKENIIGYLSDMKKAFLSALSLAAPGGSLAVMIGDTTIHGEYIPVIRQLLDTLPKTELKLKKIALRVPRHTEASWVTSQRRRSANLGICLYDFIITFRVSA
jgi:hypothetical protein